MIGGMQLKHTCVQVWALAISSYGDFVMTSGKDRSIRKWDRTDEPVFIEVGPPVRHDYCLEGIIDIRCLELLFDSFIRAISCQMPR